MVDGLVDLLDGRAELLACGLVVLAELGLEVLERILKARDVNVLLANLLKLAAGVHGVSARVAQKRDERQEELRADDVHLGVQVRDVHDARVVELALGLQRGDEHGVLAALVAAVLVELLEVVLVPLAVGGVVILVLHVEHDGDHLHAGVVQLAEDVVALGTVHHVVVLVELRLGEGHHAHAVELHLAVLLEGLSDELYREAAALVAQAVDLILLVADGLVLVAELLGHLLAELRLHLVALELGGRDLALEGHDLLALLAGSLAHRKGLLAGKCLLGRLGLRLQLGNALPALGQVAVAGGELGVGLALGAQARHVNGTLALLDLRT